MVSNLYYQAQHVYVDNSMQKKKKCDGERAGHTSSPSVLALSHYNKHCIHISDTFLTI